MIRTRQHTRFIIAAYIALDIVFIIVAFALALHYRQGTIPFEASLKGFFSPSNPFLWLYLLWVPLIILFNQMHGLYYTNREQGESSEILDVIKSVAAASFVVIVVVYFNKVQDFPRSIMIISGGLIAFNLSIWRVLKKILVSYLVSRGYNNFNTVIVGAGKVGTLLAQEIKRRPALGINIVGYLDDYKTGRHEKTDLPILGRIDQFEQIVKSHFINKVFITIYHDSEAFIKILETAHDKQIAVRVIPQGYEWITQGATKYNLGIIPVLAYSHIDVNYQLRTKRIFDALMATGILLVLSPLFFIISVAIYLDSPGPIFYFSRRYGQQGRIFSMIKFRSMIVNADDLLSKLKDKNEVDGPIFKIKNDPRMTKVGAFLRKYSLDELPQLINVINGDMSLVGPRPLPMDQVQKEDFRQLKRLNIRPGMTGLWQIKGRSDVSFDRLLRWDIWYINNWSFGLDMFILWQTIPVVIKGRGAY